MAIDTTGGISSTPAAGASSSPASTRSDSRIKFQYEGGRVHVLIYADPAQTSWPPARPTHRFVLSESDWESVVNAVTAFTFTP